MIVTLSAVLTLFCWAFFVSPNFIQVAWPGVVYAGIAAFPFLINLLALGQRRVSNAILCITAISMAWFGIYAYGFLVLYGWD